MESLQAIKNRIQSIQSTRQITQSMRLVSTSKVQKARAHMEANRPFLRESSTLIEMIADSINSSANRYLRQAGSKRAAVIVVGGDRGLCGGYNTGVNKETSRLIGELGKVRLITIGGKPRDYFRRRSPKPEQTFIGISENPFFDDAVEVVELALKWYDDGEVDQIHIVYTKFESMLKHDSYSKQLLPLELPVKENRGPRSLVYCEPAGETILRHAIGFYLSAYLFGAILESSCCEQSSRIASMDSAVKNADEMVEMLTLRYNQARQSAITQEITEIVGGASSVYRKIFI